MAPISTTYKLEVWGAQGGNTPRATGGKGGYAKGYKNQVADNKLYVYVGGQGPVATTEDLVSGGYNGGGGATHNQSQPAYNATGGGATHIALNARGELKSYAQYKTEVLIVAGGGGGSNDWQTSNGGQFANGGDGGGNIGSTGGHTNHFAGTGGTQTVAGYAKGSSREAESYGNFGLGGYIPGLNVGSAGGGGGWYGGGGSYDNSGGGGGSGYIGGVTNGTTTAGVSEGNGKALITWMTVL